MRVGSQTHRKAGLRRSQSQSQMTFTRQICFSTAPPKKVQVKPRSRWTEPGLLFCRTHHISAFFFRKMTFQVSVSRCWELPAAAQKNAGAKPAAACLERYQPGSVRHCLIYSSRQSVATETPELRSNKRLLSKKKKKSQLLFLTGRSQRHVCLKALSVCYDRSFFFFFFVSLLHGSQMDDKPFSHMHSPSRAWKFLFALHGVRSAFPTRANVKQTVTELPVNSSQRQNSFS